MHKFDEIPKRNSYNFFEQKKAEAGANPAARSTRASLLERTKLSNLRAAETENIPFPRQTPIKAPVAICVNCKSKLPEREFLKANVCAECVKSFAIIGAEFDRHSDEKARANRLKMFAVK